MMKPIDEFIKCSICHTNKLKFRCKKCAAYLCNACLKKTLFIKVCPKCNGWHVNKCYISEFDLLTGQTTQINYNKR